MEPAETQPNDRAPRDSQRFIEAISNACPFTLYVFDRIENRTIWASRQITRDLGYTPEEIRRMGSEFLPRLLHPDDLARLPELLARWDTVADGVTLETEYRIRHADGTWHWFLGTDTVFSRTPDGQVKEFLGATLDITERKLAAEERARLERQVLQAQKLESLGLLAGGVAHDFNNLLTSILGYANLAAAELPADSHARALLQEIEQVTQRAAELTRQMLAYSGRGQFVVQVTRLDEVVRDMAKLLRTVVSTKAEFQLDLQPAPMLGDVAQIRQIVMNLITNASDALGGEAGVVAVRTGTRWLDGAALQSPFLRDPLPDGDYAFVEVADTGVGMNEDTLSRIFDPFFTTKFTGRGLGLAAVLGIVRGHRGTISVTSAPGKGTRIRVAFPRADESAPKGDGTPTVVAPPVARGAVLVADDEPSIRAITRKVLEDAGFRVLLAPDGTRAVELFQADGSIRAVVLDLTMPGLDGRQVAQRLKALRPDIGILFMSGYDEAEVFGATPEIDASVFLRKPFHPVELIQRVSQLAATGPTAGR